MTFTESNAVEQIILGRVARRGGARMTLIELKAQIALGEDSRRRLKRNVTNADSLAAEMAAFANSESRPTRSPRLMVLTFDRLL